MYKNIIIGADFVPTTSNYDLFKSANLKVLFGKSLLEILNNSSYKIFNLEIPFTKIESPILKCGPNLIANPDTINTYKTINVNLLTLANNHIMDQGEQGLKSTIKYLNDSSINYVGAGINLKEASKPFIFEFNYKKIGIYACCEHEFSIATDKKYGANPFDQMESFDHIYELEKKCDYLIVLYHGGKEEYRYPSPLLQKVCRKFIEKGANLVVCQHSHCIGCEEKYKNGTILYGQGNFIFDNCNNEYWNTSLLVSIDNNFNISYIPLIKNKNTVRLADNEKAEKIIKDFNNRSREIKIKDFIDKKYNDFAKDNIDRYLIEISGRLGLFGRILNKITKGRFYKLINNFIYKSKTYLSILNFIECESHRELIINGLKNKFKKGKLNG